MRWPRRYRIVLHLGDDSVQQTRVRRWRHKRAQRVADEHNNSRFNYSRASVERG